MGCSFKDILDTCTSIWVDQKCCVSPVQSMEHALLHAAKRGDLDKGKQLIEEGCPVNAQDAVSYTCMHAYVPGDEYQFRTLPWQAWCTVC